MVFIILVTYRKNHLVNISLPTTLQTIGDYAFYGCNSLANIVLPEGLTELGQYCFAYCDNFASFINLPSTMTTIPYRCFYMCQGLKTVQIPEHITSIGNSAFEGCSNMQTLVLPEKPIHLGSYAFDSCKALQTVTLPVDTDYSMNPFEGTYNVSKIYYTYGATGIMPDYSSNTYSNTLQSRSIGTSTTVILAEGITRIGNYGFYNSSYYRKNHLVNISLPTTLQTIGDYAFYGCNSLANIVLPEGLTELGQYCFAYCSALKTLSFTGTVPAIGANSFLKVTATAFYPFDDLTWTSDVRRSYGGTITWRTGGTGKVLEWNIVLEDSLTMMFHLQIAEEAIPAGQLKIRVDAEELLRNICELSRDSDGCYVANVKIAASQMKDTISVQVINGKNLGEIFAYTVRGYCNKILTDESHGQYHALVKELLNYGGAAQAYFDYNTENLANEGITGTATTEIPEIAEDLTVTDKVSDLSFYGASLVYRDRIAVRYYFTGDITGCTFTANGNTYTPAPKDGMYYIEIADILPQDLDQQITLTVTDASGNTLSVTYGPMNYIVRMNQKDNVDLKNLLKALYNYHLAAKALRV